MTTREHKYLWTFDSKKTSYETTSPHHNKSQFPLSLLLCWGNIKPQHAAYVGSVFVFSNKAPISSARTAKRLCPRRWF